LPDYTINVIGPGSVLLNGTPTTSADFVFGFPSGSVLQLESSGYTTMTITDDDAFLGGDNPNERSADTSQQTTTITGALESVYIDFTYTVQDSLGNLYTLYVIDVGNSPDASAASNRAVTYIGYDGNNPPPFNEPLTTIGNVNSSNTLFPYATLMCFLAGTQILTPGGEVPVEDLTPGMVVTTPDGPEPVLWIGQRIIRAHELRRDDRLLPIRIAAGALGADMPYRSTYLSQQHRVAIGGAEVELCTGQDEVLAAAHSLTDWSGVTRCSPEIFTDITYYHLLLGDHQLVYANGLPAETLLNRQDADTTLGADMKMRLSSLAGYEVIGDETEFRPLRTQTVLPVAKPWEVRVIGRARSNATGPLARFKLQKSAGHGTVASPARNRMHKETVGS